MKPTISGCQSSRFFSKARLQAHMALDPAKDQTILVKTSKTDIEVFYLDRSV